MSDPIRFSHLRAYGRSALHGRYARLHDTEPTAAMEMGLAVHAIAFNTKSVVSFDGPQRRGKEWEVFKEANAEAIILKREDGKRAFDIAEAIQANAHAREVLQGTAETTLLFKWFGLDCRVTPDVRGIGYVTELKTCPNANPERFQWHSLKMAYHAQLRFQQIGSAECGFKCPVANLVAVEYKPPYAVQVFRVTDEALKEADKLLISWMERLKTCEASQAFPAYSDMIWPLDVPRDADLDYGEEDA